MSKGGMTQLVLFVDDIDPSVLSFLVVNKIKGVFNSLVIKLPMADKDYLIEDLSVITGASIISEVTGVRLENLDILGSAEKIIVQKDKTTIIGGKGKKIKVTIAELKNQIEKETNIYQKKKLQERVARLSNGVAVIRVGALTEAEIKYLKLKIEDAANATKAALEEGVVEGGGIALLKVANRMPKTTVGERIMAKALKAPFKQILKNAGVEESEVLNVIGKGGYDAKTGEVVADMYKAGIIDPFKVTKNAIQNATSVAGIFLTTEAVVVNKVEEKKQYERNF
jgi:chaperonin GroEL